MSDNYSMDNSGNRTGPHPDISDPVAASGQDVEAGSKDTDATVTVEQGKVYAITSLIGVHIFGILDTGTAANCIWACGSGKTIVIRIPMGTTSLHYQTPSNSRRFILRKLAE